MSLSIIIPWTDTAPLAEPLPVPKVDVAVWQDVTVLFPCVDLVPPVVSPSTRSFELRMTSGSPGGTVVLIINDQNRFAVVGAAIAVQLTDTETNVAVGLYYLELRDLFAGNNHVLARRYIYIQNSPSAGTFSPAVPPGIPADRLASLANATAGLVVKATDNATALTTIPFGTGTGDMTKAVYDTDGDGVLNVGAIPTSFATTAYVTAQIAALVNSAPGALDTLEELADALGDDANFAATMTTALAGKVPTTRTITINGTGLDLSGDRSFTVGNVRTDAVSAFTKQQNFGAVALTSSAGHVAWSLDNAQFAKHALTENTTLDNPTNMVDGGTYVLKITQHASAAKTLAFGSAYKWPGGSAPTISTGLGAIDVFTFVSDGVNMYGVCQKAFA